MGFTNPKVLYEHCTHPDHGNAAWPTNPCISLSRSRHPRGLWLPPTLASQTAWSSSTQLRRDAQVTRRMSRGGHQRGSLALRQGSSCSRCCRLHPAIQETGLWDPPTSVVQGCRAESVLGHRATHSRTSPAPMPAARLWGSPCSFSTSFQAAAQRAAASPRLRALTGVG